MTASNATRAALVVAAAAALAATFAAATHAAAAAIGWLGATSAFAMTIAFAATGRGLDAPDDLTEPREPHGPSRDETMPTDVTRRGVFESMWAVAAGAFALLAVVPFVALARRPAQTGTAWRRGARLVTPDGKPLRSDDLVVGGVETVFPEGNVNAPESATMLLRLPPGTNAATGTGDARRDWVQNGNIAFSKICTHAGCPVAIYREQARELYCPCHQSIFDVTRGGKPVSGPATRALPQLGLDVDGDGYLIARGDFTEAVGPDSWGRTA